MIGAIFLVVVSTSRWGFAFVVNRNNRGANIRIKLGLKKCYLKKPKSNLVKFKNEEWWESLIFLSP